MKKTLTLLIIALFNYSLVYSQSNSTKKADRLYDRLEYVKAAEEYLKLSDSDLNSEYVITKLANCYYYLFETRDAEKWFKKIINKNPEAEMIYRYSQMLKANGKYKESNKWMNKFSEMKPYDSRAASYKNIPNYIDKIIEKGKRFNIQNLKINSEYSDFGSTVYKNKLYFVSSRNKKITSKNYGWNEEPFLDIYSSSINDKGSHLPAGLFDDLNSKFHEGTVTFSPDGNTAYFTRESYYENEYQRDSLSNTKYSQSYIYKATKLKNSWDTFESLEINDINFSNKNPRVSPDGEHLYFSSNMPGGSGQFDLYKAKINEDGSLGKVENLGENVNTEGHEAFPYLSDENILYFSSDGHLGLGGLDVFYSENKNNKWSESKNIGIPINSGADDFAFIIQNEDGYVSSNRYGGVGKDDIYSFKKIRPLCDFSVETLIVDAITQNPIDKALTSISDAGGEINSSKNTNTEGLVKFIVECKKEIKFVVSKEGYESKIIDVQLLEFEPPLLKIKLDPIEELIVDEKINLNPIYFEYDKFDITNEGAFELDRLVEIMRKYPEMKIKVESHSDNRGSDSYNLKLSENRANSMERYVVSKGIDSGRISSIGKGENEPIIDCKEKCSEDDHAANRRSEFIIIDESVDSDNNEMNSKKESENNLTKKDSIKKADVKDNKSKKKLSMNEMLGKRRQKNKNNEKD
jgi:outer membrane protein OmpA-like peptidoglycan-associated protein/tetratricopeptide (TPR) repeat protein|tara:strand:- start:716 stop:2785 length:2070 start_codon:yes stop_codon:yes gene_type:complete